MARTLIGQLVLTLRDNASREAKRAAADINGAFNSIERNQKRLAAAPWGVGFQRQLDALKLMPNEIRTVERTWTSLQQRLQSSSMNKALKTKEVAAWKTATVANFAAVRAEVDAMDRAHAKAHKNMLRRAQLASKPIIVAAGAYTGAYAAGLLLVGGVQSGANRQREYFRQDMAGMSAAEKQALASRSVQLSQRYTSVGMTETMELGRTARNLMGGTDRGNQILDTLVQGLAVLKSSKGVDAGSDEMNRLQRGLDILGVNAAGDMGVNQVKSVLEGVIRATQIEGRDFDVGSMFQFARRASASGTAMSPEFLANVAPAFIQQYGADVAGTAFQSAYKSFVIGANDSASKVNLDYQKELGLRSGPGKGELIAAELYSTNPYAWAKQYLVPALEKAGVDVTNNTEVTKAISKMTRNSKAAQLLAQMVTQLEQFDKNIEMYNQAQGLDAADRSRAKDPYAAGESFMNSLGALASAIGEHVYPVILPGLNGLTDWINTFAEAVRSNPQMATGLGIAGGVAAGGAAILAGRAVYGLITAGTSLNAAAIALQRAAVMQAGGGALGDLAGGKGGWLKKAAKWAWPVAAGAVAAATAFDGPIATAIGAEPSPGIRRMANQFNRCGQVDVIAPVIGGLFAVGALTDRPALVETGTRTALPS
jgi:hypothetical protein